MGAFDEYLSGGQAQTRHALTGNAFDDYLKSEPGDIMRGFKTAFEQVPQLGYGLAAIAASAIESAAGEGGLATSAKNWAVKGYQGWGESIQARAKETDEFDVSYGRAKEGDFGALVDWLQYGVGYSVAQGIQILGTGGAGALVGRAVLRPAVEKLASGLVTKEAERLVAGGVAREAAERQAVATVATQAGALAATGAQAFGMEGGEIGGALAERAVEEGRTLTGSELARAAGATALAGLYEFAGDALGLGAMLGKVPVGKTISEMTGVKGRVTRGLVTGAAVAPIEGATEYLQTGVEEYGKGLEENLLPFNQSPEAQRQALNAAALGTVGGAVMGGGGGVFTGPRTEPQPGPTEILRAPTVDQAIATAMQATDPVYEADVESSVAGGLINSAINLRPAEEAAAREAGYADMERQRQERAAARDQEGQRLRAAVDGRTVLERMEALQQERVAPIAKQVAATKPTGTVGLALRRALGLPEETEDENASVTEQGGAARRAGSAIPADAAGVIGTTTGPAAAGEAAVTAQPGGTTSPGADQRVDKAAVLEPRPAAIQTPPLAVATAAPKQEFASTQTPEVSDQNEKVVPIKLTGALDMPNAEAKRSLPVAESQAPVTSEPGDAGVAPGRAAALPQAQPQEQQPAAKAPPDAQAAPAISAPVQTKAGVVLQNRDRSSPASVAQMQSIAGNPDPARLSFSRDMTSGAPVVFYDNDAKPEGIALGRTDTIVTGTGRRVQIQYAVVPAEGLIASNSADGSRIAEHASGSQGKARAVAGNGRLAGLQEGYRRGTTARYQEGIAADAGLTGIAPKALQGMSNPVLVRVMSAKDITENMGDETNVAVGAALDPVEQARTDSRRLDLEGLQFGEAGGVSVDALRRFVQAMPATEQAGLIDQSGAPSQQAEDRLVAAVFWQAYGDEALTRLAAQARDPEARAIVQALTRAAPAMVRLEGAKDLDIRGAVRDAARLAISARRNGVALDRWLQQGDIELTAEAVRVAEMFSKHIRSSKAIAERLTKAAEYAYNEASKAGFDMFGVVPKATREQVLGVLDDTAGQENLEQSVGGAPDGRDDGRSAVHQAGRAGEARPSEDEQGRPAAEATGEAVAVEPPAERPRLDLTGQTETQVRSEEALRAREARETDRGVAMFSRADRDRTNIDTATRRMSRFIDEYEAGNLQDNDTQILGPTPTVLRALGGTAGDLHIDGATVRKILGWKHRHAMTAELMRQLPAAMYDPVMVFDSPTESGEPGKLLLTQLTAEDGAPVVVAVHLSVASAYGMEDAARRLMNRAPQLEYFRNESSLKPPTTPGQLNLPDVVQAARDSGASLLNETDVVNGFGLGFSRGGVAGMLVDEVQSLVDQLTERWANAPPIKVIGTMAEAPEAGRRLDATQRSQGAAGEPKAFFHRGVVYVVADALHSPADVLRAILHEVEGHYGLRGAFGTRLDEILKLVASAQRSRVEAKGIQYGLAKRDANGVRWSNPDARLTAAEEVLAEIAQSRPESGLVKRAIAVIRQFLREIGFDIKLSDNDIVAQFIVPARNFVERGRAAEATAESGRGRWLSYVVRNSNQIKHLTENRGTFDPTDPDIRFSRAAWIDQQPADTQEALRKAGVWYAPPSLNDRIKAWSADWQKRVKQGVFDQFDPIKEYDYHAYMLARMTRGADAALDGLLHYGTVYLDQDGAVDVNFEKGGFLGSMSKLAGEHDRFLAWVIGNRAERLRSEGREHNFTPQDITRLKALNQGQLPDGRPRTQEYARVRAELDRYNKSVLDIAEKAGLIDGTGRQAWEKDFYIPFYRLMEDADQVKGPMPSKGLVNQYAFKVLKGGEQALGDPMENILKNWAHLLDASLKNQAARESLLAARRMGVVVEGTEDTVRQMAKAAGLKDAVVSFTDQGAQRWFMVEDAFLLDAIKAVGFSGFQGTGVKVMQKFKKWLTLGVTVSPTFRIRNVIRDSLQMIGTNPASYNVLDNVLVGWQATKEGSEEFAHILAGGGVMRFGTLLEGDRAEHVKRLIESGVDDKTILTTPQKIKDMLQESWDWWQHVGDRAENINRVALYKKLRAEGKTHLEASFAGRDTMDFSMQGTWAAIRFLSQTVPFWNARLQGLYKLGRGAAEDPRRFGVVVGGAALASMALLLAYRDDDDWKKREDFDRETYWWFKVGDKAFRIPKPFEIGAIATLAERGLEAMTSDELTGKQFAKRVFAITAQQLSMNPVPQIAMPLIELYANRDSFTDRPIEGMGMERLSKPMRAGPHTSATAQLLGKNGFVSPAQIDHLVNGYFGWLGSHVVSTADLALRPSMGLPPKPAWRVDEVLVVGDFVKDLPAYQSKYVTRLYDQMKDVQQAMADLKELQKAGATEEAKRLLEDKDDKIRLYRLYTHAEKQMETVNRQIKLAQIRIGDTDTKRERLDALYATRNRIAQITEDRARSLRQ